MRYLRKTDFAFTVHPLLKWVWLASFLSHTLLILQINTTFEDVQMMLKWFFDFSTDFRFSKISSVHIWSCPCITIPCEMKIFIAYIGSLPTLSVQLWIIFFLLLFYFKSRSSLCGSKTCPFSGHNFGRCSHTFHYICNNWNGLSIKHLSRFENYIFHKKEESQPLRWK